MPSADDLVTGQATPDSPPETRARRHRRETPCDRMTACLPAMITPKAIVQVAEEENEKVPALALPPPRAKSPPRKRKAEAAELSPPRSVSPTGPIKKAKHAMSLLAMVDTEGQAKDDDGRALVKAAVDHTAAALLAVPGEFLTGDLLEQAVDSIRYPWDQGKTHPLVAKAVLRHLSSM